MTLLTLKTSISLDTYLVRAFSSIFLKLYMTRHHYHPCIHLLISPKVLGDRPIFHVQFWWPTQPYYHWCASVINKRILTPFRDGIWNRRQVSVGDTGVLPTWPRNPRGYALLAGTLGKMRTCVTGKRSNTEICTVELKKYNYTAKLFPVASTSHTFSPG